MRIFATCFKRNSSVPFFMALTLYCFSFARPGASRSLEPGRGVGVRTF
jgi:hypothetical protein